MFKTKPSKNKFEYLLILSKENKSSNLVKKKIVARALEVVRRDYAIYFKEVPHLQMPILKNKKIPYILYGPVNPLVITSSEFEYLKKLSKIKKVKINVISTYDLVNRKDSSQYKRNAAHAVSKLSKDLGINIIFPDEIYKRENVRSVDWEDVRDNIICETVRVKYSPERANKVEKAGFSRSVLGEIKEITRIFRKYRLWHRDQTDGAVMIRAKDSVWLITQTKTDKTKLSRKDFSLIKSFSEERNKIRFIGGKIPSSDSPELLVLGKLISEDVRLLIHFHKNEITRNKLFLRKTTKEKIEYGLFKGGRKMYEELKSKKSNWLVLKEHGVLWTGKNSKELEKFLREDLNLRSS